MKKDEVIKKGGMVSVACLVEAGLAIAMAFILHLIVLFQMPQGGSVTAASMAPLLFFAYRWGGRAGILVATVAGFVHFILGFKFTIHPLSILLDYILAYGVLGVAGFFKDSVWGLLLGSTVASCLRWAVSVVSGAIVFGAYAPAGQNPWVYSVIYNISYMLPNSIISIVVLIGIYGVVRRGIGSIHRK